jgi:hypothetical protein
MRKVRDQGTGLRLGEADCLVKIDTFRRRLVYHSGRRSMMQRKRSKLLVGFLIAGLLGIASVTPTAAQNKSPEAGSMPKVGDMAPDFALKYFDGKDLKEVSLSQYRGKKNVVLGFFIFAFTGG